MKTIFRYTNLAILMAGILAIGAVTGMAQDPCTDAAGLAAAQDNIQTLFKDKSISGRKAYVAAGKTFIEKYSTCEPAQDTVKYFRDNTPKLEDTIRKLEVEKLEADLIARFNPALEGRKWDEVYAAGKELMTLNPDKYRDVELVLGSIGYDESYKNNFKHNDDTLKYAHMAIADLEAGKKFSTNFGVPKEFVYKSKENALGWMNMVIGYITGVPQKNKAASLPFLFKATQSTSVTPDTTAKNPIPYELIGNYYFDELNKLATEIKTMAADQKDTDTAEVAKEKVDAIKAKIALSNGMAERAMDAFTRAYTFSKSTPEAKPYKDKMKKNVSDAYNLRFGKTVGVDAWMSSTVSKPFIDPATPVAPITDADPTTAPATGTTTPAAPAKPVPPATKPSTITKPAAAPAATNAKPQAKAKKAVAKKKTT